MTDRMAENKVIIYTANDGTTKIDVKLEEETLWLTQTQMCELYQTSKSNVSEHIKASLLVELFGISEQLREVEHYNLDMIIQATHHQRCGA